jgi:hypothetical protein
VCWAVKDWINVSQNRGKRKAVVSTAMSMGFAQYVGNFWTSCGTASFHSMWGISGLAVGPLVSTLRGEFLD